MIPDDTLLALAVAREVEAHRAGNRSITNIHSHIKENYFPFCRTDRPIYLEHIYQKIITWNNYLKYDTLGSLSQNCIISVANN